jgi:protein-S-isoprenylcysteine O-methyltransferase Ste14
MHPEHLPHGLRMGLAGVGLAAFVWLLLWGARTCRRSLGHPGHPRQSEWMIRGIRHWILGGGFLALTGWIWSGDLGWLLFAGVFLGEELVETGVMLLAARQRKRTSLRDARTEPSIHRRRK